MMPWNWKKKLSMLRRSPLYDGLLDPLGRLSPRYWTSVGVYVFQGQYGPSLLAK